MCETSSLPQDAAYERCLRGAREAKEQGNSFMNFDKLREAAFSYKKGCLFLTEYIPVKAESMGDSLSDMLVKRRHVETARQLSAGRAAEVMELYAILQNNLALVNLKLHRYTEGVKCATVVLSLPGHESNRKALLRRARCNLGIGELKAVESDYEYLRRCTHAEGMAPDAAEETLGNDILKAKKELFQKEREMCRKMFAL